MDTNALYYGDNLNILRNREYFPDSSVDLIYLDPPFNSQQSYNILFKENDISWSPAQIKAFEDTWRWDTQAEATYQELITRGPMKLGKLLSAMREGIGANPVMAYLVMMAARLAELHRVLKPTGSLYLHCDPTMSHYIKLVLDQIFGPANFRNEIVWKRTTAHNDPKRFGRVSDTILYYSKTDTPVWNQQYTPYREAYYESHFKQDTEGRYFRTVPLDAPRHGEGSPALLYEWHGKWPAPSRTWAVRQEIMEQYEKEGRLRYTKTGTPTLLQYADEMPGALLQNVWTDIPPVNPQARERLGFETQKPLALLERIIQASSNEGDIVLDPFCGCGTALVAAHKLNRKWVGIDITHLAIAVMKRRLLEHFPGIQFKVVGEPVDLPSARELARQKDRYQFQWWALSLVGARPVGEKKKGADQGIDGVIPFPDDGGTRLRRVVVSVKSGHVSVKDVRELKSVAANDPIGLLLTLEPPTQPMKTEAAEAGFYESPLWQKKYPRLQILTVEEALAGKKPDMPSQAPPPKAAPIRTAEQPPLM